MLWAGHAQSPSVSLSSLKPDPRKWDQMQELISAVGLPTVLLCVCSSTIKLCSSMPDNCWFKIKTCQWTYKAFSQPESRPRAWVVQGHHTVRLSQGCIWWNAPSDDLRRSQQPPLPVGEARRQDKLCTMTSVTLRGELGTDQALWSQQPSNLCAAGLRIFTDLGFHSVHRDSHKTQPGLSFMV